MLDVARGVINHKTSSVKQAITAAATDKLEKPIALLHRSSSLEALYRIRACSIEHVTGAVAATGLVEWRCFRVDAQITC
jgi:hypothetical protein